MCVDDIDVRDLSFDTLRTRISIVLQETVLFSGTIRDNVAFSAPDASQADLERAAEIACADGIHQERPEGGMLPSASAAPGCPAASASAWQSRGPSQLLRMSSFWMT